MQSVYLQPFGNQHIGSPINLELHPLRKQNYMLHFNTKAMHIILQDKGTSSPSTCHKKAYGDVETQLHSLSTLAVRTAEWSALDPLHFTPSGTAPSALHLGGQSGPRTGPGKLCRRKNSCPCRVSWLPSLSSVQNCRQYCGFKKSISCNSHCATSQLHEILYFPKKDKPPSQSSDLKKTLLFTLARFLCHLFTCFIFRN